MANSKVGNILLVFLLTACSPRIVERITENVVYRDSISYRDTTFFVPIPLESGQVIVNVKDTARAETSVAQAVSYVDTLGHLNLSLSNKNVSLSYVAKIPARTIEMTMKTSESLTKTEYIEKPLSKWQSLKIGAFWWLLAALAALLVFTFKGIIKKIKL